MQNSLYKEAYTAMNYSKNLASENDPNNNLNSSPFHIIFKKNYVQCIFNALNCFALNVFYKLTKESYFNFTSPSLREI